MNLSNLGTFVISQESGNQFAEASGDFNPLHTDPVMARRYQFGSTVVHGLHGLLKALDLMIGKLNKPVCIKKLKVQFNNPIRHGETVDAICSDINQEDVRIELHALGKRSQSINASFIECKAGSLLKVEHSNYKKHKPVDLSFADVVNLDTCIDMTWNRELVAIQFPNLINKIPDYQIAILMGLTNIVGMHCPGLNSVFGGFAITFNQNEQPYDAKLHYKVIKHDSRFSLISIAFNHAKATGEIEALFRPMPVQQPSLSQIKTIVKPGQFEDQRALVIGGSRGLGEVTAKLIAAGGGIPVISYTKGADDAASVINDICNNGMQAKAIRYNVLAPSQEIVSCLGEQSVSHIYYFASPLIEKNDSTLWNQDLFVKFSEYYLSGLAKLLDLFLKAPGYRKKGMTVFVPSTIFLEQPQAGFNEYVAVKAATEAFAAQFENKYPGWRFATPRLPRMLTDQTSGVAASLPIQTAEVMYGALLSA